MTLSWINTKMLEQQALITPVIRFAMVGLEPRIVRIKMGQLLIVIPMFQVLSKLMQQMETGSG